MTRIIAGKAGGRRLAVPGGQTTRPTSDRAREGLFGTLLSEIGPLDGKRMLDLYAGSGAVGLEALSRGAGSVLLIESDARAAAVIKANIKAVDLPGASVVTGKAERVLARPAPQSAPRPAPRSTSRPTPQSAPRPAPAEDTYVVAEPGFGERGEHLPDLAIEVRDRREVAGGEQTQDRFVRGFRLPEGPPQVRDGRMPRPLAGAKLYRHGHAVQRIQVE